MSKARQPTVLLVDDDPALLRGLSRGLTDHQFQVIAAVSAPEASALLSMQRIDAIVCDHRMPGTTGLSFLETALRRQSRLVAILLTGEVGDMPVALQWAKEIGIHKVLDKPCDVDVIAYELRAALSGPRAFAIRS